MLITGLAQGRALPNEVNNQILDRTDGVPLFVEELTKVVLESGLLRKREHDYVLDGPLAPVAIPTTLHASLMARLDRLTSVRQVAQVGAALGRQFSHELLHAVAEMPERQLRDALEKLVRAELLFRRGVPPNAQYTFKHALVQDVAYASLLRANRQQLHARIARAYETRFPEVVHAQPELVAFHFTEAGLSDAAIEYWQRAGDFAMARSGHAEAIHHFSVALDLLSKVGEKEICGKDFYRVVFSTSFGFVFLSIRSFCPLPPCRLVFDLRAGAGQSTNAAFHAFDVARLLPPTQTGAMIGARISQ
jgi:predicted ATPase